MKLGRYIFETGKLNGIEPHQGNYFAYSIDESKFGTIDAVTVVTIPMESLSVSDDEIPHHVRSFIANFESLDLLDYKARLRKALTLTKERQLLRDDSPLTVLIFKSDGTIISNHSATRLIRIQGPQSEVIPLKSGKESRWSEGDTFLLLSERLFDTLTAEEFVSLSGSTTTALLPSAIFTAAHTPPSTIMSFRIAPPHPFYLQPVFFVLITALAMIATYYLAFYTP